MFARTSRNHVFALEGGGDQAWERPRLTSGTLFVLGAMNLIDCINYSLLTPYVDSMVSDFMGRPRNDGSVVQMVGLLIGLYALCEVLFSPLWGYLADCLGRKPVMLIGLAGSAVAPVLFGMASNLPVAFIARGLDGFFCGNIGVAKTYLGEIVDHTNEARGFSFLAVCFSLGLFIGPLLGGQLVDPAHWWPSLFSGTPFERHPYLLPNLTYAFFAAVSWLLGWCFLKETLPPWERTRSRWRSPLVAGLLQDEVNEPRDPSAINARRSEPDRPQKRRETIVALLFLLSYCFLTGYYAAWTQIIALIVALPRSIDGFNFNPEQIGMLQNAAGVGLLSTQLLIYPWLTKRIGFLSCFVCGCLVNSLVTLLFPLYGLMTDPDTFGAWRYAPLMLMMLLGQAAGGFCFPTAFVWINRSLEGKDKGTWNGWGNSLGALFRAIFPPFMDALMSFGLRFGVLGGRYLPIFVNALAGFTSMALAIISVRAQDRIVAAKKRTVAIGDHLHREAAETVVGAWSP